MFDVGRLFCWGLGPHRETGHVMSSPEAAKLQTFLIQPRQGLAALDLRELWSYRDLLYFLVWRNVKVLYKQTVLGFGWAVIRPLSLMIIFSIVFGRLSRGPSDGMPYPIFAYAALIPWTYFSSTITGATSSLIGSSNLITKVYFPRILMPMSTIVSALVDFIIAFSLIIILLPFYRVVPSSSLFLLPIPFALMVLTAAGIGLWLSALAVQFRDVRFAMSFITLILMFAAPIAWPSSKISGLYRYIYGLYPMGGVVEGFRSCLLDSAPMPWDLMMTGWLSAIVIFASGIIFFRRMERAFADVI